MLINPQEQNPIFQPRPLLSMILPNSAVVVEQHGAFVGSLLAEESELVGGSTAKRRVEIAAGRTCARRALESFGFAHQPIKRGTRREPIWPAGIVGSITHCDGYCAAAVAREQEVASLGIDVEPNEPLPDGVLSVIAIDEEIGALRDLADKEIHWDRLLFSAKESIYKAWYPMMKCWLGFDDVCVSFTPATQTFQIRLLSKHTQMPAFRQYRWSGRYATGMGYILTSTIASSMPNRPIYA